MTSIKIDTERRGQAIAEAQLISVERLRRQAFAVQAQFELAQHTAVILEEMLRDDDGNVGSALENTYEGNMFARLRLQLFRLLIVDLYACVLDSHKKSGSVRAILKELRREPAIREALWGYSCDPSSLTVTVENTNGVEDEAAIEAVKVNALRRAYEDSVRSMDALWNTVQDCGVLRSTDAKRMAWARVKAVAHLERTDNGLVLLDHEPPFGEGELTFGEPIRFLRTVAPFVYDVFALVTANSWGDAEPLDRFYVQSFWDRLKNGRTNLKLPNSY